MKLLKEMEICGLSDKEFRTILLKLFNELYEHTERQPSEISCTMQKENEKYNNNNKKNRHHKKAQTETLELKIWLNWKIHQIQPVIRKN